MSSWYLVRQTTSSGTTPPDSWRQTFIMPCKTFHPTAVSVRHVQQSIVWRYALTFRRVVGIISWRERADLLRSTRVWVCVCMCAARWNYEKRRPLYGANQRQLIALPRVPFVIWRQVCSYYNHGTCHKRTGRRVIAALINIIDNYALAQFMVLWWAWHMRTVTSLPRIFWKFRNVAGPDDKTT